MKLKDAISSKVYYTFSEVGKKIRINDTYRIVQETYFNEQEKVVKEIHSSGTEKTPEYDDNGDLVRTIQVSCDEGILEEKIIHSIGFE